MEGARLLEGFASAQEEEGQQSPAWVRLLIPASQISGILQGIATAAKDIDEKVRKVQIKFETGEEMLPLSDFTLIEKSKSRRRRSREREVPDDGSVVSERIKKRAKRSTTPD